ncbi:hypothetical protein EIP91_000961 [Steccherinum ochraceum]|uniref:HMG box domain-containing protein n=1 Tax=Steccherinum ochraceum TaxID=92696 RepID=A0A4R0REU6_9APHY|nr:hypothetical protein EIP91_000961 [Steccherinum ochraceum]
MPAIRNVYARRSRRLCHLPPRTNLGRAEYEWQDHQVLLIASQSTSLHPFFAAVDHHAQPFDTPPPYPTPEQTGEVHTPESPSPQLQSSDNQARIKRPPNAFLCYRSHFWATIKDREGVERDHRNISRLAGQSWKRLSPAERLPFRLQAEECKREHAKLYPNYKYAPGIRKEKVSKRKSSRASGRDTKRCKREPDSPVPLSGSSAVASAVTCAVKEEPVQHAIPSLDEVASRPAKRRSHKSSRKSRKPAYKPSPPPSTPFLEVTSHDHVPEFTFPPAPTEEEPTSDAADCGGFVFTSDIPHLDLNCPKPEEEIPYASDEERDRFGYPGATVMTSPSVMSRYNASQLNYSYDSSPSYDSPSSYDSSPSLASSSSSHLDSPRFINPWFPGDVEDDETADAAKRSMYENESIAPHEPCVYTGGDDFFDIWNEYPSDFSF